MSEQLQSSSNLNGQIEVLAQQACIGLAKETRRAYGREINAFLQWLSRSEKTWSFETLEQYKEGLIVSGRGETAINQALTAIKKLIQKLQKYGVIDQQLADSLCSIEAIKIRGRKEHNWLTVAQADKLLAAPKESKRANSLLCYRDRAILALLVGCGLRRSEVQAITVEHLQQREGRWAIVDLVGKRNKSRIVPMAAWCKAVIDEWLAESGIKSGHFVVQCSWANWKNWTDTKQYPLLGKPLSTQSIYNAVDRYSTACLGFKIAPHDLRRSFARLARKGGAELEQIMHSLGHDSLNTTQIYLGKQINYQNAPSDLLGLTVEI